MPTLGQSIQTNIVPILGRLTQTMNQLVDVTYHGNIDGFEAPKDVENTISSPC